MSSNVPEYHFSILSQLLRIVTSNAVGRTDFSIRTDSDDPSTASLQDQLLSGLATGKYRDDAEASRGLYNADPTDQRYMTLRSRCIDRLLNEVRHIDIAYSQLSEYSTNFFKCLDILRAGYLLSFYGNSDIGSYALRRALSIAMKYNFTSLELILRRELSIAAVISAEESSHRSHNEEIKRLIKTLYFEQVAIASYEDLYLLGGSHNYQSIEYADSVTTNREEMLAVLDTIPDELHSHTFLLNRHRSRIEFFMSSADYQRAREEIKRTLAYYSQNAHLVSISRTGELRLLMLEADIKSRCSMMDRDVVNPAEYFTVGRVNWIISNTLSAYKFLQLCAYTRAFEVYCDIRTNQAVAIQQTEAYEHRMLLEAYLWILTSILPASEFGHQDPQSKISFRESTFLNAMNVLESNKYGSNALIVIAHVFILLIQNKEKEAYRRILNLNVYATRYLKGESEQRLWYCIKALQKVPSFRTRPHMMREAMEPQIARIRRLADLPMKNGFNELVPWDVLLEAYIAWEIERSRSGVR